MVIYKSKRIGLNGRVFEMYKFRTLKENFQGQFATAEGYTKFGRFLRRYKLDELPQLINVLRGEMSLVGPRPEEERTINLLPEENKKIILSVKPGMTSLSSIHFFDEERILEESDDKIRDYWLKIKPMKFVLETFYVEHKGWILDLAILWVTFKKLILRCFK